MHDRLVNGTCTISNFHGILLFFDVDHPFIWFQPSKRSSSGCSNCITIIIISGMQPTIQKFISVLRNIEYRILYATVHICLLGCVYGTWAIYFAQTSAIYQRMVIYRFPFIMEFGLEILFLFCLFCFLFSSSNSFEQCNSIFR